MAQFWKSNFERGVKPLAKDMVSLPVRDQVFKEQGALLDMKHEGIREFWVFGGR